MIRPAVVLFDLDRTLWDFEGNADKTFADLFAQYHLAERCHTSLEDFHSFYRQVNATLWEAYRNGTVSKEQLALQRFAIPLAHFGVEPCAQLAATLSDYYVHQGPKQTGLMPGARELLCYLKARHYELAIITNGFSEAQRPKMRTSGIDTFFSACFLSEEVGYMKPDIRFFQAVLSRLGLQPSECMVVGDDLRVDIEGAQRVGIPQIFYCPSSPTPPCTSIHPTYTVQHLLDIKNIL